MAEPQTTIVVASVKELVDSLASRMANNPSGAAADKTRIGAELATIEAAVAAQRTRLNAL